MKLLSTLCLAAAIASQPAIAAPPDPMSQSTQLIVVTTPGWDAIQGRLQRYERPNPQSHWQPLGDSIAIVVGKTGLAWGLGILLTSNAAGPIKREGDGKAPAGIFTLGTSFGYAPQALPDTRLPYLALTPATECVDDPHSRHYNHLVERTAAADWNSSEKMRSAGESYRWGIVVNHNPAPTPNAGSCIFLHIWKDAQHGTVGCTAMPQSQLEALIPWIDPTRHPLLVQLPAQAYAEHLQRWHLPTVINAPTP